jgi:acetyltransferase
MAGSRSVWEGVVRQGGAIPVDGLEPWVDALMGFSMLPPDPGDRMAIISGPGGLAVSAAEACGRAGLRLAELSGDTRATLSRIVPPTGTSLRNPIDVGLSASMEMDIYIESARAAAGDPGVDAVVVVGAGLDTETNRQYTEAMIKARREFQKPFLIVNIPGFETDLGTRFCSEGVPFFESAERAMTTYARFRAYQVWRKAQAGD